MRETRKDAKGNPRRQIDWLRAGHLHSEQLPTIFPPVLMQSESIITFLHKPLIQQHFLPDELDSISNHPLAAYSIFLSLI